MKYTTLSKEEAEIRLLTIHSGGKNARVRCSTTVVSLDTKPYFEALSYTWGDPAVRKDITVDDESFLVTINLEAVLRRLRLRRVSRVIWVDAVCVYVHRHRKKYLRNLRFGPQFSEGFLFRSRISKLLFIRLRTALPILYLDP